MRACLISLSSEIPAVLSQCEGIDWINARPGAAVPEANLYIWDFEQNIQIPTEILGREDTQHLLLAEARNVDALASYLSGSVSILLKPATPFTLRAFVEMAVKTWKLRRQVREATTLRHDRDALLQYVLEVNLKLQEYDHERSNFLARALHDLRAPLTALHGYCGLLAEGKLGPVNSRQRELLERMSYSTSRLGRLASGTFELLVQGRIERTPKFAADDIGECFQRALHDVYLFLQDKNIDVTMQMEPPEQEFFFEAEQIEQVFVNLLENSCKFTQRDGAIEVRGYPVHWDFKLLNGDAHSEYDDTEANAYRIDIADSGVGVPQHLVDKVFEQYASYAGAMDRSGGGLGLAICKLIVAAHHGLIWAVPDEHGGRFSFVLPFHPEQFKENNSPSGTTTKSNLTFYGEPKL